MEKDQLKVFRRKLMGFINVLSMILSIVAAWQYWAVKADGPWMHVSATVFSAFKLYFFSPDASPGEFVSWTYEAAKWLAPFVTSVFFVRLISSVAVKLRNRIKYRFGKKFVFFSKDKNLPLAIKHNGNTAFVTPDVTADIASSLESKGVSVFDFNPLKSTEAERKDTLSVLKINKADAIFFPDHDDLCNFEQARLLLSEINPEKNMDVAVRLKNPYLRKALTDAMESSKVRKNFDFKFYTEESLTAFHLMQDEAKIPFYHSLIKKAEDANLKSAEAIDESLGSYSILIMGWNEVSEALIHELIHQTVYTLKEKTTITVIGSHSEEGIEEMLTLHPQYEKAANIRGISLNLISRAMRRALCEINTPDYIILTEKTTDNLSLVNVLREKYDSVPVAVYNPLGYDLCTPFKDSEIQTFGNISDVLTEKVILHDSLDERAKKFNDSYAETSGRFSDSKPVDWNQLSQFKKDSSRAAADHQKYKRELYYALNGNEAEEKKIQDEEDFKKLYDGNPNHEVFNNRLIDFLKEHPVIDYLTRLEHKRWSAFHYSNDFVYSEVRDDRKRCHPCLIDDWNIVLKEKYMVTYPVFDVIMVLESLKGDIDGKHNS